MEDFDSFQLSHAPSTSPTVPLMFFFFCERVQCCVKRIYINTSANIVLSRMNDRKANRELQEGCDGQMDGASQGSAQGHV